MTRWVTCREFVEFLDDYLAGRLPAVQVEEFNAHLSACPLCVTYMQTYRDTSALVKAALASEGDQVPDSVPEGLVAAIVAARRKGGE